MKRRSLPHKIDRKIFKRTASRTRAINVKPLSMRGGIRL